LSLAGVNLGEEGAVIVSATPVLLMQV